MNTKQTPVLELQAKELQESIEERRRDRDQRHRAQASRVYIWEERSPDPRVSKEETGIGAVCARTVTARVKNTSDQPVYELVINWYSGIGVPRRPFELRAQCFSSKPLMPADELSDTQPEASVFHLGAVAFFRDAKGVLWRTLPDGSLDELSRRGFPSLAMPDFKRSPQLPLRPKRKHYLVRLRRKDEPD